MKKVFTTGQVAKICKVAPRTVSKWFDSGRLRGYRIPGSQDRRIPREHLIKFLKEHGMPLGELEEEGLHKVLLIGCEKLFIDRVKELLPEDDDFKFELAHSGFEAGIQAESFHPDTIVIDLGLGRSEALQIATNLRKNPAYEATLIIGADKLFVDRVKELLPEDDDYKYELAHSGFEAGTKASAFQPDTIIIDHAMGRHEAIMIAQTLRRNEAYKETLIVALASEDEPNPEALIDPATGYSDSFKKPFDINLLAERIRTLVEQKRDL
jgi:two-component system response regulator RpaA